MLPGIIVKPLKRYVDERGNFTEIFRSDMKDVLGDDTIVQSNLSHSYPGVKRAWHRHERGQVDYFVCIGGAIKICAYDDATAELDEVVSSAASLQVVRVPGHYWHGFRVVGSEPATLVYFTTRLYDYKSPDELRRPWNDPTVVPKSINGKVDDPRVGKPWDWDFVLYK
ncbi:MAG: dTDP-4-dehydrorhamnose 3,5-epimerase family protein [Candidatus Methanosuratincola petrocarbonis]